MTREGGARGAPESARGSRSRPATTAQGHARQIALALRAQIPEPRCELEHTNAFELLIATILSAQTTDKGVNKVTPALFARYPTAAALAEAEPTDVEAIIRSTGYFRIKARSIMETARALAERHGGEVPRDMVALCALRGVARKTANVVLGTAYGIASGIPVDVHVARVSQRLGLTQETAPPKIEPILMGLFPRDEWIALGHRLVLHGRYTCRARAPRCEACACAPFCPSAPGAAAPSKTPKTAKTPEAGRPAPTRKQVTTKKNR